MLTLADMKFYTPPIANVYTNPAEVYVIKTAYGRNEHLVGTVQKVRRDLSRENNRHMFVTNGERDRGSYVIGHHANRTGISYVELVGTSPAFPGIFLVGRLDHHLTDGSDHAIVQNVRRSDGLSAGTLPDVALTHWYPAAQWAMALMPLSDDDADTKAAKVELARERWTFNNAIATIYEEGMSRDWGDQLQELHETFEWLPTYTAGGVVSGDLLIANGTATVADLREETNTELTRLLAALHGRDTPDLPPTVRTNITVRADIPVTLPWALRNGQLLTSPSRTVLEDAVRHQFPRIAVRLGTHTLQVGVSSVESSYA